MSYEHKISQLRQKFDKIISIGVKCMPSMTMVNTNLKQETFTFDWIQSNPQIVLDCIQTNFEKYNNFDQQSVSDKYDMHIRYEDFYNTDFPKQFINEYGMCFTHYTSRPRAQFIEMCRRRSDKLMALLTSNENLLFTYMNDEKINLQEKQYPYLVKLEEHLCKTYPKLNFKILALHSIKKSDTEHIINFETIKNKKITIEGKNFGPCYASAMKSFFKNAFRHQKTYPQQKRFQ